MPLEGVMSIQPKSNNLFYALRDASISGKSLERCYERNLVESAQSPQARIPKVVFKFKDGVIAASAIRKGRVAVIKDDADTDQGQRIVDVVDLKARRVLATFDCYPSDVARDLIDPFLDCRSLVLTPSSIVTDRYSADAEGENTGNVIVIASYSLETHLSNWKRVFQGCDISSMPFFCEEYFAVLTSSGFLRVFSMASGEPVAKSGCMLQASSIITQRIPSSRFAFAVHDMDDNTLSVFDGSARKIFQATEIYMPKNNFCFLVGDELYVFSHDIYSGITRCYQLDRALSNHKEQPPLKWISSSPLSAVTTDLHDRFFGYRDGTIELHSRTGGKCISTKGVGSVASLVLEGPLLLVRQVRISAEEFTNWDQRVVVYNRYDLTLLSVFPEHSFKSFAIEDGVLTLMPAYRKQEVVQFNLSYDTQREEKDLPPKSSELDAAFGSLRL